MRSHASSIPRQRNGLFRITRKEDDMKYRINKYQVVYEDNARDNVKLFIPILTDDYEAARAKLKAKHQGAGKRVAGINLDYEELK